jgi:hypothetical protein
VIVNGDGDPLHGHDRILYLTVNLSR